MDFGEYKVTVQASDGQKARVIVHAHDDATARKMAAQATGLEVVEIHRES